jgi:hypothetical protein
LLDACSAHGIEPLTVRDYLSAERLPDQFVVLRHDVERKPENALDFARMEADHGVVSTYYVRTVDDTFDPWILDSLESLGHEVGYHYEDVDRMDGDVEAARRSFQRNLARMRAHATVDTVCVHDNPLTAHDNREMWNDMPDFKQYNLLGGAYLSVDFNDMLYLSDTGRTWRDSLLERRDDTVENNGQDLQIDMTADLIELLSKQDENFYLVTHPDRWAGNTVEYVTETAFDTARSVVKYGLQVVPSR